MKTKYKYFKDFNDAFVYYGKSVLWYYKTDYAIRYSRDVVINDKPARMIALYDKDTGEVIANAELHYSLCKKYVVIIHDYRSPIA